MTEQSFSIEALRGVAALSVTWFHLTNTYQAGWVRSSGTMGWLGVEIFFVISGFVIPYSLHQSEYRSSNFPRFMLRRLVRLEPPYLASIALVVILTELSSRSPGFAGSAFIIRADPSHILYVIPLTEYSWVNVVYWSLAYEFVFYLVIGALWPILCGNHLGSDPSAFLAVEAFCWRRQVEPMACGCSFSSEYVVPDMYWGSRSPENVDCSSWRCFGVCFRFAGRGGIGCCSGDDFHHRLRANSSNAAIGILGARSPIRSISFTCRSAVGSSILAADLSISRSWSFAFPFSRFLSRLAPLLCCGSMLSYRQRRRPDDSAGRPEVCDTSSRLPHLDVA